MKETKAWCLAHLQKRDLLPSTIYIERRNVASRPIPNGYEIVRIAIRVITKPTKKGNRNGRK